jgi:hypothetical protein
MLGKAEPARADIFSQVVGPDRASTVTTQAPLPR